MKKQIVSLFIVGLLCACGGSSDSTQATEEVKVTESTSSQAGSNTSDNEVEQHLDQMQDLEVSTEFDLTTHFQLDFVVMPDVFSQRVFINVCSLSDKDADIDHQMCLLRTSVNSGGFQQQLTVPNSDAVVVAEIWYFEHNQSAKRVVWQRDPSNSSDEFIIQ